MLSSLSAALLGLSVSLNSLPVSNENAPGRTAESKPAYGALEVTGETKREENLKVSAEEYTDLFHVEDLPQIERLDLRAEHFLVAHPDALAPGADADRVEIRVDRRNQTMTVLLNGKE